MAVLGQITLNEIILFEVDEAPTVSPGVNAPEGSLAIMTDGQGIYQKQGSGDTDWRLVTYLNSYANRKYHYRVGTTNTNTTTSFNDVSTVSTPTLPVGTYEFKALIRHSSAATATGMGLRINIGGGGAFGSISVLWSFMGGGTTNGATAMMWDRLQFNTTDNYFAPNTTTTTNNLTLAHGVIEVTTAGVPVLQFRSETAGVAVSVLANSIFWFDRIL